MLESLGGGGGGGGRKKGAPPPPPPPIAVRAPARTRRSASGSHRGRARRGSRRAPPTRGREPSGPQRYAEGPRGRRRDQLSAAPRARISSTAGAMALRHAAARHLRIPGSISYRD